MLTNWYVIQVPTKKEKEVCNRIKGLVDKSYYEECFVPLAEKIYKKDGLVKKTLRPLFPGYLFMISDDIEKVFLRLKKVPYFTKILHEDYYFVPLEDYEVNSFVNFLDEEKIVTMSVGYIEGAKVFVTSGPLKGQEGKIRKIDRHKRSAMLEMSFMGQITRVNVPLEIVSKI